MKKVYLLTALAGLALVGCTSDDLVNTTDEVAPNTTSKSKAIGFNLETPKATRASKVGAEAATELGNKFFVYATKHVTAEDKTATNDSLVFDNWTVGYTANTAGTTESNTANWEYVGLKSYSNVTQTIRYWDYGAANGYTFYAFSSPDVSNPANSTNDLVSFTKITSGTTVYDKGYSITVKNGAKIDKLYYADRQIVNKSAFGDPVTLTFRSIGTQIRVGFYETIPGYSVKIDSFYYDDNASAVVTTFKAMDKSNATNFTAAVQNVSMAETNTFAVTYNDATLAAIENRAKVTPTSINSQYTLTLGKNINTVSAIGTSSASPTWDNADGSYNTIFPFANSNAMLIRVNYTLKSTDGKDIIRVKNARVTIPKEFVTWKSNYAYTYLFKISNNTNGTTGITPVDPDNPTGDPEGLFPITFDAVAMTSQDGIQETITNIANDNITTYEVGANVANNEYKAGDIFVSMSKTTPAAIGTAATNAQVYEATTTGDSISEASVLAKLTGMPNGITLTAVTPAASLVTTVPNADGTTTTVTNKAVKFTAAASKTYAFVYTVEAYVAPTYTAVGSDAFDGTTTYYLKTTNNVYYAASGIDADNFEANKTNLYTMTNAGTSGSYIIKVIKVGA